MFKIFFLTAICIGLFSTSIFCMSSNTLSQKQDISSKVKSHWHGIDGLSKATKPKK